MTTMGSVPPWRDLANDVKYVKSSMILLMDQVSKIRAENRVLSLDVRKLMKSQDYNFDDLRRELVDVKAVLDFESLGQQTCESPENGVPPDAEVLSNSDMVDVATLMGNGELLESTPPSNKKEIIQIESHVDVKQEEMDSDPLFEPSTSVVCSTPEQNAVVISAVLEQIPQGDNNIARMETETEECEKRASEPEKRKMVYVAVSPSSSIQVKPSISYCWVCQKVVHSTKCGIPTDDGRLALFEDCARQTMDQTAIDSLLERVNWHRRAAVICDTHIPGYREAALKTMRASTGLLEQLGKQKMNEETISVASTSSEQNDVVSCAVSEQIPHGDSSISRMETGECEKRASEPEKRKMVSVAVASSEKRTNFIYCVICRRGVLSTKCIVPEMPQKRRIFLKCAKQTMNQREIDSLLARTQAKKGRRMVCESHVPGYKKAVNEIRYSMRLFGPDARSWEEEEERVLGESTVKEVEEAREEMGTAPCTSVATTSSEENKFVKNVMNAQAVQYGDSLLSNVWHVPDANFGSNVPWMKTEEYEKWAEEMKRRKIEETKSPSSSIQVKPSISFCWVCQKVIHSTKCGIPTDDGRMKLFEDCARQTMDQTVVDSLLERAKTVTRHRRAAVICDTHVPGYREAALRTMRGSSSFLEQWGKQKMKEGTEGGQLGAIEYGKEKDGIRTMSGVVTREQAPCTFVASTSSEQNTFVKKVVNTQAVQYGDKSPSSSSAQVMPSMSDCWVCQKVVHSTKCGIPTDDGRMKLFEDCARQTLDQTVIDSLLERAKTVIWYRRAAVICDSHVPGYREATKRAMRRLSSVHEQWGKQKMKEGTVKEQLEVVAYRKEKNGIRTWSGVVTREQKTVNVVSSPLPRQLITKFPI